jgi:uncharacterized membrane protein
MWPSLGLLLIVGAILALAAHPRCASLFRRLPTPLWCYLLPLLAVSLGWLPAAHPAYPLLTAHLLPVALGLLLLGVDLPATLRAGRSAWMAAALGAVGVMAGGVLSVWLAGDRLPPLAWKGAGALAGTWTGGTMNLLALRTLLDVPEPIFAPLIIVDALFAYAWMAVLVAAAGFQEPINRWLRAPEEVPPHKPVAQWPSDQVTGSVSHSATGSLGHWATPAVDRVAGLLLAVGLAWLARAIAGRLPTNAMVSSVGAWTILLVTTAALALSWVPPIRRLGQRTGRLGSPFLSLVLAATGAQARLGALASTPGWLLVGGVVIAVHGGVLLGAGRLLRIPVGVLAVASQANIGGVISAPLVGAVYHTRLVPIALVLALAGNALGTYLGLLTAAIARYLVP